MSTGTPTSDVTQALRELTRGIAQRAQAEDALARLGTRTADAQQQALQNSLQQLISDYEQASADLREEQQRTLQDITDRYRADRAGVEAELNRQLAAIERQAHDEAAALQQRHDESSWVVSSVLDDTSETSPRRQYERNLTLFEKSQGQQESALADIDARIAEAMDRHGWQAGPLPPPDDLPRSAEQLSSRFHEAIDEARQTIDAIRSLWLPKLFAGFVPLGACVLLAALLAVPAYLLLDPGLLNLTITRSDPMWIAIVAGGAAMLSLIFLGILYTISSMRVSELFTLLQNHEATARGAHHAWLAEADRERRLQEKQFRIRQQELEGQRQGQLHRFRTVHEEKLAEIENSRTCQLEETRTQFSARFIEIDRTFATLHQQTESAFKQQIRELTARDEAERPRLQEQLDRHQQEREQLQQQAAQDLTRSWSETLDSMHSAEARMAEQSRQQFADWVHLSAKEWQPTSRVPAAIRLGEYGIVTAQLKQATPRSASLSALPPEYRFPARLSFPEEVSVLFKMRSAQARPAALSAMQVMLLRLLTLVPPGKLRLTIFDPIGLGESFSGFMHLADFDELLITSRIWTESAQIESQLARLTEHMENVLQKYLRNEFASIEDYNRFAGEVAEPYHILVVTDFPSKISEQAAQRLMSVATSGPRCGVFLLMSVDTKAPVPHGFDLAPIEHAATTFEWADGAFHLADPDLRAWPLVIDTPPPPETFTSIVKNVGEASRDVRRVEVSFSRVAPPPDDVWKSDSRRDIDIPIGRAGALKLQRLQLGRGTSQHMLVAGKTGSGKSTFFHALITSAALHYGPDELHFFLVDFKKGVEFKAYASQQLPHARVIAIESDREFGVSVLQRLDAILHERGDLFRRQGVQDIRAYRDQHPHQRMPRIMLVIDEFQEFFVEDDQLSQTAGLLLDRLVRQGRAFGIHVILGSQTLGGAYSLARSTLGQVAVRVALQCSESDAHLILSEDNTAARLLNRPGEAIYNDANGRIEGNHPFQIAWLPDEEREAYLVVLRQLALEQHIATEPAIVFEGNIPSDPGNNSELVTLLNDLSTSAEPTGRSPRIWLGESVQIGPPTSVDFHPQAGSNLLVVGQDESAASGILATGLVTLAAQSPGAESSSTEDAPVFWVFDGHPVGTPDAELWKRVANVAGSSTRIVTPPAARQALEELSTELARRASADPGTHAPLFLLITNLSKFRDLRKDEDDFGLGSFGSRDAEAVASPGKRFSELLTKGPEVGIHTLMWADTYSNVERWLSRQSLKEFELKILFQMNAGDSSNLIDSPAASRLGVHRALLYREETGTVVKFRPYGPPKPAWLDWAQNQLQALSAALEPATDLDEFPVA